jgi:hypothetical protein
MSEWWEFFIDESISLYDSIASLGGISNIGDALEAFISPLVGALIQILMLLVYPFVILLSIVQYAILTIMQSLIDILNGTVYIINDIGYLLNLFQGVFTPTWIMILGLIILVNLGLRIYFFVKDISILGNKI